MGDSQTRKSHGRLFCGIPDGPPAEMCIKEIETFLSSPSDSASSTSVRTGRGSSSAFSSVFCGLDERKKLHLLTFLLENCGMGQQEEVVAESAMAEEKRMIKVLVVDDSPVDRMLVERMLRSSSSSSNGGSSFHVIAVDSGKKAMELLGVDGRTTNEQKIDIVLTDYCMPEMSGLDLLRVIKEQSFLKPLPVIVMSSEEEPQRISRCLMAGAADFILKPLQTKDIHCLRSHSDSIPPKRNVPSETAKNTLVRKAQIIRLTVVSKISRIEILPCLPSVCKLLLLVYAIFWLGEMLHRWSFGCFLL